MPRSASPAYTPPLGYRALTPLYDAAIALMTREKRWRPRLVAQIDPQPGDRILDIGCGTGSLAVALQAACPGVGIVGLDPDGEAALGHTNSPLRPSAMRGRAACGRV